MLCGLTKLGGMIVCKVILIGNYKGGVGKTTTTLNLAIGFAKMKNEFLLLI